MFTATTSKRQHSAIDEAGHALVWRMRKPQIVEVTYPGSPQVDHHGREWTLPQGNFRAAMTFTQWLRDDQARLVITYVLAQRFKEFREHQRRFMASFNSALPQGRWPDRWYPTTPMHDAHLIYEGMSVLFSSIPELRQRFDRIEVHRVVNGDRRDVFTGEHPGIAGKIEEYRLMRARQMRERMEETERIRKTEGDVAALMHAIEMNRLDRDGDETS